MKFWRRIARLSDNLAKKNVWGKLRGMAGVVWRLWRHVEERPEVGSLEKLLRISYALVKGVFILRTMRTLEQIKAAIFSTFDQEQAIRREDLREDQASSGWKKEVLSFKWGQIGLFSTEWQTRCPAKLSHKIIIKMLNEVALVVVAKTNLKK